METNVLKSILTHLYRSFFAVHGFVDRVHVSGSKLEREQPEGQQGCTSRGAAGHVGQVLVGHGPIARQQLHH